MNVIKFCYQSPINTVISSEFIRLLCCVDSCVCQLIGETKMMMMTMRTMMLAVWSP